MKFFILLELFFENFLYFILFTLFLILALLIIIAIVKVFFRYLPPDEKEMDRGYNVLDVSEKRKLGVSDFEGEDIKIADIQQLKNSIAVLKEKINNLEDVCKEFNKLSDRLNELSKEVNDLKKDLKSIRDSYGVKWKEDVKNGEKKGKEDLAEILINAWNSGNLNEDFLKEYGYELANRNNVGYGYVVKGGEDSFFLPVNSFNFPSQIAELIKEYYDIDEVNMNVPITFKGYKISKLTKVKNENGEWKVDDRGKIRKKREN